MNTLTEKLKNFFESEEIPKSAEVSITSNRSEGMFDISASAQNKTISLGLSPSYASDDTKFVKNVKEAGYANVRTHVNL